MAEDNIPKWEDTLPIEEEPTWENTQAIDQPGSDTEFTQLESFGQGALDIGSMGFSDEAIGAYKALVDKLGEGKDFSESYKKYRDVEREKQKLAAEQNPLSYGAGGLVGGIGTALIPGLGAATAGKTATQLAAQGAALGGAYGLGATEAELTEGDLEQYGKAAKDVATGATTGAVTGVLFPKLFAKPVSNPAVDAIKKSAIGAGIGSTIAATGSEGDISSEEGREQLYSDVLSGAGYGALGGLAAKGLQSLGSTIFNRSKGGKLTKQAFQEGLEGNRIDAESGYLEKQQKGIADLAKKAQGLVEGSKQAADESLDKARQNIQHIQDINYQIQAGKAAELSEIGAKQMSQLEDDTQKLLKLSQEKAKAELQAAEKAAKSGAKAGVEAKAKDLENQLFEHSKKVDASLRDVQKTVGSQIDEQRAVINNALTKEGNVIKYDIDHVIADSDAFLKENIGNVPTEDKRKLMNFLLKYSKTLREKSLEDGGMGLKDGRLSFDEYRTFKNEANKLLDSVKGYPKYALKNAVTSVDDMVNSSLLESVTNNPEAQQALNILKTDLNPRYSSFKVLEEELDLMSRKAPGSQGSELTPKLPKAFKQSVKPEAEHLAATEGFKERMKYLGLGQQLEEGQALAQGIEGVGSKVDDEAAALLKSQSNYEDLLAKSKAPTDLEAAQGVLAESPEYQAAKKMAAKSPKDIAKPTEEMVESELKAKIAKEAPLAEASKVKDVVNEYEQKMGKGSSEALKKITNLVQEADFLKDTNKQEAFNNLIDTVRQLHGDSLANQIKDKALELSNKYNLGTKLSGKVKSGGESSNLFYEIFGGLGKVVIGGANVAGRAVSGLNKATPAALASNMASKARSMNLNSLAGLLEQAGTNADSVRRSATIFSIKQNPTLRKQYEEISGEKKE